MRSYSVFAFFLFLAMAPQTVLAADHYVRAGATGNNSGTDWTNAHPALPATLVRGDTYYIADGNYAGYTFDDPESGPKYVYIKKAIGADHGTGVGWNSAYGDNPAIFGVFTFQTGYYEIDGQIGGGPQSWKTGHGFKIKATSANEKVVRLDNGVGFINIKHCELVHRGLNTGTSDDGVYGFSAHDITISHCYLHDFGRVPFLMRGWNKVSIEYCYIARNTSTAAQHAEGLSDSGSDNVIIRHNLWSEIQGTAILVCLENGGLSANWEIYGNVFSRSQVGGVIRVLNDASNNTSAENWKIYNNTVVNFTGLWSGFVIGAGKNNVAYNNLWYNCSRTAHSGVTISHSWYYNTPIDNDNTAVQTGTGNPFVNLASENFQLITGTSSGLTLNAPYDKDADGKARGGDGTWDRGAFEFNGAPGGNRAPIPNAGPDRYVEAGTEVTLDGSASSDPNGDPLTYLWSQISGSSVQLSSTTQSVVRFTPTVAGTYLFRLNVGDGQVTATDEVTVVVQSNTNNGLVAYWKVDESSGMKAGDFVGAHDGTLINGPAWLPYDGKIGGALDFDGVDDFVDIGAFDITGGNGLTIALWVKADNFKAAYARFIAKVTKEQEHYWILGTSDDGTALRFSLKAGGATTVLKTNTGQLQAGIWYHVAATYDGKLMRLYKNNVEVVSVNKSGAVDVDPNVSASIGNQPLAAGGNWPFDGLIDDIRIYNRALSPFEIAALANPVLTGQLENPLQAAPVKYELHQNYPNPFNPSTTIAYSLPKSSPINLAIYDLNGRKVFTLVDEFQPAGRYEVTWNGINAEGLTVPTGTYYYALRASAHSLFGRMMLLK